MCGITGFVYNSDRAVERDVLERMNCAIEHRGPDEDGFYIKENVGLAMRRLSIIDLAGGQQPMHTEDRTKWIVYNGEIYNYRELREDLDRRGHKFYTNSDTEAIVHLYDEFGEGCLEYLRGMFAFAIWDERDRSLFITRDRVGKMAAVLAGVVDGRNTDRFDLDHPPTAKSRQNGVDVSRKLIALLLIPDINEIGVGAAQGKSGRWYFVQVFGRPHAPPKQTMLED